MEQIILHQTPTAELVALISTAVAEQLQKQQVPTEKEPLKLLTRHETARMLGISLPTLHVWTKDGTIQGGKIGSRVRYRLTDVEEALRKIKIEPRDKTGWRL